MSILPDPHSPAQIRSFLVERLGKGNVTQPQGPRRGPPKHLAIIRCQPRFDVPARCVISYYYPAAVAAPAGWYDITIVAGDQTTHWQKLHQKIDGVLRDLCREAGIHYGNPLIRRAPTPGLAVSDLVLKTIGDKPVPDELPIVTVLRTLVIALQTNKTEAVGSQMMVFLKLLHDPVTIAFCRTGQVLVDNQPLVEELERLKSEINGLRQAETERQTTQPVATPPVADNQSGSISPFLALMLANLVWQQHEKTSAPVSAHGKAKPRAQLTAPTPSPVTTKKAAPSPNPIDVRRPNPAGRKALKSTKITLDGFLDMLFLTDMTDDSYRQGQLDRIEHELLAETEVAMHDAYADIYHVLEQVHGLTWLAAEQRIREIYEQVAPLMQPVSRAARSKHLIYAFRQVGLIVGDHIDVSRLTLQTAKLWHSRHNPWAAALGLPKEFFLKLTK